MKAKLTEPQENAINYGGDKELIAAHTVVASTSDGLRDVVICRLYQSRSGDGASPVYASIWVHGKGIHASGRGVARGYGYHKASAAIGDAIRSAGFVLSKSIDGVGDRALEDALVAVARAVGFRGRALVVSH